VDPLNLAQIAADLTVELARRADIDPLPKREWYHRYMFSGPDPRFTFTQSGLMLAVCSSRICGIFHLFTPWGRWKICGFDGMWSAERVEELLAEFDAQLVPKDEPVYTDLYWGNSGGLNDIFALRCFGDVALPEAVGTSGLGTGYAAQYPLVLSLYPDDYRPYWAKRREWGALARQLHPSPGQRRDAEVKAWVAANSPIRRTVPTTPGAPNTRRVSADPSAQVMHLNIRVGITKYITHPPHSPALRKEHPYRQK
jgi:hypothetical protein